MTTTLASPSSDLLVAAPARGAAPAPAPAPAHAHAGHDHRAHDHGSHDHRSDTADGHGEAGAQDGHRHAVGRAPSGLSLIRASLAARLGVAAGLSILIWAAVLWARLPIAS